MPGGGARTATRDQTNVPTPPPALERPKAIPRLGETGPLSQGVQVRGKVLRIRHINGVEVRKKRPRGFKKRPRGFK
jgi:hypothetical protein